MRSLAGTGPGFDHSRPSPGEDLVECCCELAIPVANLLYLLAEHAHIEAKIMPPDDWKDPPPTPPTTRSEFREADSQRLSPSSEPTASRPFSR
jgi:hypothetical protein